MTHIPSPTVKELRRALTENATPELLWTGPLVYVAAAVIYIQGYQTSFGDDGVAQFAYHVTWRRNAEAANVVNAVALHADVLGGSAAPTFDFDGTDFPRIRVTGGATENVTWSGYIESWNPS